MAYIIDARLERGAPSLTLIDAVTGEEHFHWRRDGMSGGERAWEDLFKRLVLLSCADRMGMVPRAKLPLFGNECVECTACVDREIFPAA